MNKSDDRHLYVVALLLCRPSEEGVEQAMTTYFGLEESRKAATSKSLAAFKESELGKEGFEVSLFSCNTVEPGQLHTAYWGSTGKALLEKWEGHIEMLAGDIRDISLGKKVALEGVISDIDTVIANDLPQPE